MKHPNPTAELIAKHFYDWCSQRFPNTVAIHVSETPKLGLLIDEKLRISEIFGPEFRVRAL